MESDPSDILCFYRAKDADEKLFAQIKVDLDGSRIRTHNQETTEGKAFVTFIACGIRSCMLGKLSKLLEKDSTSMKKILSQLSDIVIIANSEQFRFTKTQTKKQKEILSAFDATEDIMEIVKRL